MSLTHLKENREALFWSLHALGWSAYGISHYLGSLIYSKPPGYLAVIIAASISGFALSAPLRYLCRRLWTAAPATLIACGLLAAYSTAVAWRVVVNIAYVAFMEQDHEAPMTSIIEYFGGTMSAMYLMTCWVGLYLGFKYYESMQLQREAVLRSAALAQEAQFKMLRYQLNPHFLFNTLNAISTLILDNRNATANAAVTALSEFLRYTLDQDPMKRVTVAQEVEALNLYLDIEKMRFGERLSIQFSIDDEAARMLTPSLLLQPLIENAIKYAVSPRERGGRIHIRGRVADGVLHLEVADDGPGLVNATRLADGRGVGLRNTRERLRVLYADRGIVAAANTEPGLCVALSFPAEPVASTPPQGVAKRSTTFG